MSRARAIIMNDVDFVDGYNGDKRNINAILEYKLNAVCYESKIFCY